MGCRGATCCYSPLQDPRRAASVTAHEEASQRSALSYSGGGQESSSYSMGPLCPWGEIPHTVYSVHTFRHIHTEENTGTDACTYTHTHVRALVYVYMRTNTCTHKQYPATSTHVHTHHTHIHIFSLSLSLHPSPRDLETENTRVVITSLLSDAHGTAGQDRNSSLCFQTSLSEGCLPSPNPTVPTTHHTAVL